MRIVGTIEARMGSTRLPGKTLSEIHGGMHLLECVVRRFRLAGSIADVAVATTTETKDDPIAQWCNTNSVSVFRGAENDVLARVAGAATHFGADAIVQMGADSAYLDYQLVDRLTAIYREGGHDYVCNDLKLTFPIGIYAHVVSVPRLIELSRRTDLTLKDRENVVTYFWQHPEHYRLHNIEATPEFHYPELRLTVDYAEDIELARSIYRHFGDHRFTTGDILGLYRQSPGMFAATIELAKRATTVLPAQHPS